MKNNRIDMEDTHKSKVEKSLSDQFEARMANKKASRKRKFARIEDSVISAVTRELFENKSMHGMSRLSDLVEPKHVMLLPFVHSQHYHNAK